MSRLEEIRDRLDAITAALRDESVTDTEAGNLASEAAQLTAEAAKEAASAVDRLEQG
ncbi:MAG: hypothetical protein M3Y23_04575 [Actinomycetota bacterium]|nr:hypothetical protein [Actinomycetota bacterium]